MQVSKVWGIDKSESKWMTSRIAAFIIEHNFLFNISDHLRELIKSCSPDSTISKSLACGRTKCTSIVKKVNKLKISKFLLLVDESTDKEAIKYLALVVRLKEETPCTNDDFLTLLPITEG